MFYIGFVSGVRVNDAGWRHAVGELTLGAFSERFEADLGFWEPAEYEAQWRKAALRLLGGAPTAALVASYRGPEAAHHSMWPMWRDGTVVHVQGRLVLTGSRAGTFDPAAPEAHLGGRTTESGDGSPVSEWTVPLGQLANFALEE
jgi:hypothetical protein